MEPVSLLAGDGGGILEFHHFRAMKGEGFDGLLGRLGFAGVKQVLGIERDPEPVDPPVGQGLFTERFTLRRRRQ